MSCHTSVPRAALGKRARCFRYLQAQSRRQRFPSRPQSLTGRFPVRFARQVFFRVGRVKYKSYIGGSIGGVSAKGVALEAALGGRKIA